MPHLRETLNKVNAEKKLMSKAMPTWASAAVARGLPAVDLSTTGTTTSENTEKEVPPHLLAAASDGEALI